MAFQPAPVFPICVVPQSYNPSLSTGIFGNYSLSLSNSPQSSDASAISDQSYMPSLNTGVFGVYITSDLNQAPQYRPSLNTGVFGVYLQSTSMDVSTLKYLPSLNTGIFGVYSMSTPQPTAKRAYLASLNTGIFGVYRMSTPQPIVKAIGPKQTGVNYCYRPSVCTGVFGTYDILDLCAYRPSLNNGVFGTFQSIVGRQLAPNNGITVPFELWKPLNQYLTPSESDESSHIHNLKLLQQFTIDITDPLSNYAPKPVKIFVCQGSVVQFDGDCIVNAANEGMVGGGGVDGAITSAGGRPLDTYRRKVPCIAGKRMVRCPTGEARLTHSGYPHNKLKCRYVAHAVGPNYTVSLHTFGGNMPSEAKLIAVDRLLYDAYANTISVCHRHNLWMSAKQRTSERKESTSESVPQNTRRKKSGRRQSMSDGYTEKAETDTLIHNIGFCLISAGIFKGPQKLSTILQLGCRGILDALYRCASQSIDEIYIIGYTANEVSTLQKVAPQVFGCHNCTVFRQMSKKRVGRH